MSLAALARDATGPRIRSPRSAADRAARAGDLVPQAVEPPSRSQQSPRSDGFDSLVKYIPTETVTVFVAICSARSAIEAVAGRFSYATAYWSCAALTPVFLWLIATGRHRNAGGSGLPALHWWPLVAATIAFLVWALSVPGVTRMLAADAERQDAWGVIAGIGAVLVSLVLSLLEPVFGPRPVPGGAAT